MVREDPEERLGPGFRGGARSSRLLADGATSWSLPQSPNDVEGASGLWPRRSSAHSAFQSAGLVREAAGDRPARLRDASPASAFAPGVGRLDPRPTTSQVIQLLRDWGHRVPDARTAIGPAEPLEHARLSRPAGISGVVGGDNRVKGNTWSWPLRCVGEVISGTHIGSGCLIGPRHVLTCGHVMQAPTPIAAGTTFTVRFPAIHFFGQKVTVPPFVAKAIDIFPVSMATCADSAFGCGDCFAATDFVVLVLDKRLGDGLGNFGGFSITGYATAYEGLPVCEAGILNGVLEANLNTCSIKETENCWGTNGGVAISQDCDMEQGHSGGPLFLWTGPTSANVIGVVSILGWPGWGENVAGGGDPMVKVALAALKAYP